MRAFLGLDLPAGEKLAVQSWRDKAFPTFEHPVPAANLHITLAFLGEITSSQSDKLGQLIQQSIDLSCFNVTLDMLGYFPKPKAFWVGCSKTDPMHQRLARELTACAHKAGIVMQKRAYQAHVTLARKCHSNPPAALIPPGFSWQVDKFHLFESLSGPQGVRYPIRHTWLLRPKLAMSSVI